MCAVPSAARRQIHIGARREGKQRRNQREAEEEKQRYADKAPHKAIVAKRSVVSRCCGIVGSGPV
jgi:hypothetical protein